MGFPQVYPTLLKFLSIGCLLFSACRNPEFEDKSALFPSWDASELHFNRVLTIPGTEDLRSAGFPELQIMPLRLLESDSFEFAPKLKLLEFGKDFESYAAFQSLADPDELAEGLAHNGKSVFFRKGRWLGRIIPPMDSGLSWISSHLKLPGKSGWGEIPEVFSSMLHRGRIRSSERVLLKYFLGMRLNFPVFSVEIDCWGDTAMIYASPEMRDDFAKNAEALGFELTKRERNWILTGDSVGNNPLNLEFGEEGMVGVEGCFDSSLTNQWIKNQKIAINSLKSTQNQ